MVWCRGPISRGSPGPHVDDRLDDRVAALQYRDPRDYAVGHGVSVHIVDDPAGPAADKQARGAARTSAAAAAPRGSHPGAHDLASAGQRPAGGAVPAPRHHGPMDALAELDTPTPSLEASAACPRPTVTG